MQSGVSFSSQNPQDQSYWQQYAPQKLQDLSGYVSQKTKDAYNAVSNWNTRKKIAVASAIIGTLAAIYNREEILQWVGELLHQKTSSTNTDKIDEPLMRIYKKLPPRYKEMVGHALN
jgi:hypothetical protein